MITQKFGRENLLYLFRTSSYAKFTRIFCLYFSCANYMAQKSCLNVADLCRIGSKNLFVCDKWKKCRARIPINGPVDIRTFATEMVHLGLIKSQVKPNTNIGCSQPTCLTFNKKRDNVKLPSVGDI